VSRGYEARRKARRQQALDTAQSEDRQGRRESRLVRLVPAAVIFAALLTVAALGISSGAGSDREQVQREVAEVLGSVPQNGTTLGSTAAPVTLLIFADLECPTVKLFVEAHLPSILDTWVRPGKVKLEYRSLRTDTSNERTFFKQEVAALAAGRQDRMWDFVLTFARQQGEAGTDYATGEFLADIASQVPGLGRTRWEDDREDPVLAKQVALELHSARVKGLQSTPALLLRFSGKSETGALRGEVETSLSAIVKTLVEEASDDVPTLGIFDAR
jgi:protein-disulfide isomerase